MEGSAVLTLGVIMLAHLRRVWVQLLGSATPIPMQPGAPDVWLSKVYGDASAHCFQFLPKGNASAAANIGPPGRVRLRWRRQTDGVNLPKECISTCALPVMTVQRAPVVASLESPVTGRIGEPMALRLLLSNRSTFTERLTLNVDWSPEFCFAGLTETARPVGANATSHVYIIGTADRA
jgi:hypothetical protein